MSLCFAPHSRKLLDYFALGILPSLSCKWLAIGNILYSYAASFPLLYFSSMSYCFFCIDCDDAEAKHLCLMIISCTLHLFLYFSSMFYCFFCINCDDAEAKTPLSDDIIMYLVNACIYSIYAHNDYVNWRNSTHS